MKKKRERLDIIQDILYTIQTKEKIGPTRLLQISNLSPKMFRDYIKELTESNLIIEQNIKNKKKFSLTENGYKFLERYKIFSKFVEQLGL